MGWGQPVATLQGCLGRAGNVCKQQALRKCTLQSFILKALAVRGLEGEAGLEVGQRRGGAGTRAEGEAEGSPSTPVSLSLFAQAPRDLTMETDSSEPRARQTWGPRTRRP